MPAGRCFVRPGEFFREAFIMLTSCLHMSKRLRNESFLKATDSYNRRPELHVAIDNKRNGVWVSRNDGCEAPLIGA